MLTEKKENYERDEDELRGEYDFSKLSGGIRGKYVNRYREGTNIIHLDSDVASVFKTDEDVNQALRSLMNIAKKHVKKAH